MTAADRTVIDREAVTRDPSEQRARDAERFDAQIAYLYARSPFYREKLECAGFENAGAVGGLDAIADLPFTEKDELRISQANDGALGKHCAVSLDQVVRIYSTSGTTGQPLYIPLTRGDLAQWAKISQRAYTTAGIRTDDLMVTTWSSGPFAAGASMEALQALGVRMIPVGAGNHDRVLAALQRLHPQALPATPSYAVYIAESGRDRGLDPALFGLRAIVVGGEPGGGETATRDFIEASFGATCREVMGIGDVAVSLWAEPADAPPDGMHFCGQDFVHVELIEPESGVPVPFEPGASGELVYTHLKRQAAPLLRFRSRDHVRVLGAGTGPTGRTGPRIRCIGRTDDLLIVRGVNIFPSAIREVVDRFRPRVSGAIEIRPTARGVRQSPPLPVRVEIAEGDADFPDLAAQIEAAIRAKLVVTTRVELVAFGGLPRSDYKARLVNYSDAE